MMTAAEHVAEAERLIKPRTAYYNGGQTVREEAPYQSDVDRAKVHATLALVLVTEAK